MNIKIKKIFGSLIFTSLLTIVYFYFCFFDYKRYNIGLMFVTIFIMAIYYLIKIDNYKLHTKILVLSFLLSILVSLLVNYVLKSQYGIVYIIINIIIRTPIYYLLLFNIHYKYSLLSPLDIKWYEKIPLNNKFSNIDTSISKCVAICLLLFHHLFFNLQLIKISKVSTVLISNENLAKIAYSARVCVWMFAFLSAYGLTLSLIKNNNINKWVVSRICHLLVPFQIFMIGLYVFTTYVDYKPNFYINYLSKDGKLINLFFDLFALNDIIGTPKFMGIHWYISFTLIVIILIPILYKLVENFSIFSILVLLLGLRFIRLDGIVSDNGGLYTSYFPVVLFGVIFAKYNFFNTLDNKYTELNIIKRVFLILFLFILAILTSHFGNIYQIYLFRCIGALLIIIVFHYVVRIKICYYIMSFIGNHSYFMFLTHIIVKNMLPNIIFISKNVFITTAVFILVSLIVAIICQFAFDLLNVKKLVKSIDNILSVK